MSYSPNSAAAALRAQLDAALAAHRGGNVEGAVAVYRQVLAAAPDHPDALNLLGTGLLQLGRPEEAVRFLEAAVRKQRNNTELLANLAHGYTVLGQYDAAEAALRKAVRIEPARLHFQLGVAGAVALQGKPAEAEALLRRLASRHPETALVWFNLGNALRDQKKLDEATAAYRKALELDADFTDARNNLGSVLHAMLRFAEAESCYRECVARAPDHALARFNLASVVMDLGRFAEAEALGRELLASTPLAAEAHGLVGAALGHQGRLLEARECHRTAAQCAPDDPKVAVALSGTLMETGRPAEGLRWFVRALAGKPDTDKTVARQVLSTALLAHGTLQEGWKEYDSRPAAIRFREKYPELGLTRSLAPDLRGKHVLVVREQGLGDELFFLRYAPRLAARGARISYRPAAKIASLVSRIDCVEVVDEQAKLPARDACIMVGDLPHALGALESSPVNVPAMASTRVPDFAHHVSLFWPPVPPSLRLAPDAARVAALRERLAALGPAPYIGVTWRAGTVPEEQNSATWMLYKTVPLDAFGAALRAARGTLLALQRNPSAGEIGTLAAASRKPVHDFTALNEDLEEMLALLACLDDYATVSNTNVHLRAAVGGTSRVLVPIPAEWRWMQSGRASPWFPGSSIYRQSLQGDWAPALASLARDLEVNYREQKGSNRSSRE